MPELDMDTSQYEYIVLSEDINHIFKRENDIQFSEQTNVMERNNTRAI